jgi:hypothetical protein
LRIESRGQSHPHLPQKPHRGFESYSLVSVYAGVSSSGSHAYQNIKKYETYTVWMIDTKTYYLLSPRILGKPTMSKDASCALSARRPVTTSRDADSRSRTKSKMQSVPLCLRLAIFLLVCRVNLPCHLRCRASTPPVPMYKFPVGRLGEKYYLVIVIDRIDFVRD